LTNETDARRQFRKVFLEKNNNTEFYVKCMALGACTRLRRIFTEENDSDESIEYIRSVDTV